MILLFETVQKALVEIGSLLIPLDSFDFDYNILERLFLSCLNEYFTYKGLPKQDIFLLNADGINLKGIAKEVNYIKPHFSFADQYNDRMTQESWRFTED